MSQARSSVASVTSSALASLSGLGFGLSLIIAIGAQNAFVLRQGLRREHVGVVVAICALSDLVLIIAGVAGVGALVQQVPWLLTLIRFGGAAFLFVYAALAAKRALRPERLQADASASVASAGKVALTVAALTWLNPHVYLDTVLLLGSIANAQGDHRWAFGVGAGVASILWFAGLGFGARGLAPIFDRPSAWRVLDAVIAVIMAAIGTRLLMGI